MKLSKKDGSLQRSWMVDFYQDFCDEMNFYDFKGLPIRHSQDKKYDGVYIRKECHDTEIIEENKKVPLFIDIIDDKESIINNTENYFHVTFGAITYFTRNVDVYELLKPIKDIYNPDNKTSFCSYCYKNITWGDAPKRHQLYEKLNNKRRVHWVKDDKRFDKNLFNHTVNLLKPYRFNIAYENKDIPGYINEKIFNSYLSGSIPIFNGSEDIFKYFRRESMIYVKDYDSIDSLINYILKVDDDKELMNKYLNQPPCDEEGLQNLFWWKKLNF